MIDFIDLLISYIHILILFMTVRITWLMFQAKPKHRKEIFEHIVMELNLKNCRV